MTVEPTMTGTAPTRRPRLDPALIALAILFAFAAGSGIARNADVWFRLATGRMLVQGDYVPGSEPFRFDADSRWVNHSWLMDLIFYLLYSLLGGAGLVVVKALLVAGLAAVLLCIRRPDGRVLVPILCTLLAVLTMTPRLLLQPTVVSFLFLAATFFMLRRLRQSSSPPARSGGEGLARRLGRFLPLFGLFVLWANLDVWFWLGPLLLGAFSVVETLQARQEERPSTLPILLVPIGLLVCLVNPHGTGIFTLPLELSPVLSGSGLKADLRFRQGFASPWLQSNRWTPLAAVSLADLGFFLLFGLGATSFVLAAWKGDRAETKRELVLRLVVWLAFAVLGSLQTRLVPFFAVVAGPIAALNLGQAFAGRPSGRRAFVGSYAVLNVELALILLACMGMLRGFNAEGRQVAWGLHEDPSLRRAAETIRDLRDDDKLPDDARGFVFHPDVASYLAWFCPGEKVFFDHRLTLDGRRAREFEDVCRELLPALAREDGETIRTGNPLEVFEKKRIAYAILYDPDARIVLPALSGMIGDAGDWDVASVDGRAVLLARRDAWLGVSLNPERRAFGKVDDSDFAPAEGPGRLPRRRPAWKRAFRPDPPTSWEGPAASVYLRWFEAEEPAFRRQAQKSELIRFGAGLTGAGIAPHSGPTLTWTLALRSRVPGLFVEPLARSPALPLLAVRAARRGLVANPDDAEAYLRLGQAYHALTTTSPEALGAVRTTLLGTLRHVQTATALEQALLVDPDLSPAHAVLADLYTRAFFLDAALEHRQEQLRLVRAGKADPGRFRTVEALQTETDRLESAVLERRLQFINNSKSLRSNPLAEAREAQRLGLARHALDKVLLPSDPILFGAEGAAMELELLLMLGRASEAGELLDAEEVQDNRARLGPFKAALLSSDGISGTFQMPTYEWLSLCRSAATGEYGPADETLRGMLTFMEQDERRNLPGVRRGLMRMMLTEAATMAPQRHLVASGVATYEREVFTSSLFQARRQRAARVELHVLSGLLALEQGRTTEALADFVRAGKLSSGDDGSLTSPPIRALAATYEKLLTR